MPELPEVQTIVNDLKRAVVRRKIKGAWFDWPRMFKPPTRIKSLTRDLKNKKIVTIERRAKYIKVHLSSGWLMVFHLKMTGRFWLIKKEVATADWKKKYYAHLILFLDEGLALVFSDMRKFGTVRLGRTTEVENLPEIKHLGPEPLDIKIEQLRRSVGGRSPDSKTSGFSEFVSSIGKTKRKIKPVLMDPKIIAGIGNIYSDEALWLAKIHPLRRADSLTANEFKNLLAAIKKVLQKSLKLRGTTARDYRDLSGKQGRYYDQRLVYHREDEPCLRCHTKIKRIRIGGRSAHFCPHCQKT